MITENLPDRLKEVRISKGFTQEEVAAKLNITRQTLSNYERGAREPSPELLAGLIQLYDISADWLLTGRRKG